METKIIKFPSLINLAGSINKTVFADGLGFECPKNMKLLGYVSDEEAKTLMRDCKAFLFPTFYEGFGIPPLEAISAGCKCIVVSDTPVMHEVFGDSVKYINIAEYQLSNINMCDSNQRAIEEVLENYSWKKSAQKLLTCLERIGGGTELVLHNKCYLYSQQLCGAVFSLSTEEYA